MTQIWLASGSSNGVSAAPLDCYPTVTTLSPFALLEVWSNLINVPAEDGLMTNQSQAASYSPILSAIGTLDKRIMILGTSIVEKIRLVKPQIEDL